MSKSEDGVISRSGLEDSFAKSMLKLGFTDIDTCIILADLTDSQIEEFSDYLSISYDMPKYTHLQNWVRARCNLSRAKGRGTENAMVTAISSLGNSIKSKDENLGFFQNLKNKLVGKSD